MAPGPILSTPLLPGSRPRPARRTLSPLLLAGKTTMQYKTIVLGLIEEQYPVLYEQLRKERLLLKALDLYAPTLKPATITGWTA